MNTLMDKKITTKKMNYEEEELELYSDYMDMVREMIKQEGTYLTPKARKNMLEGNTLYKIDNSTWCLIYNNEMFKFMSFNLYNKLVMRDNKLNELFYERD